MSRTMISHRRFRKDFISRNPRPLSTLELLENRQLLSTFQPHALPSYNLTGFFLPATLPRELAGQPLTGTITVAVTNAGTLGLSGGQKVNIRLMAHTASKNVLLSLSNGLSVANLAPGGSKQFAFDLKKATVPPVGDYTLQALITPSTPLAETSTADNLVTSTAAQKTIALHVAAPDLTGTLLPSSLPALVLAGNKNPVTGSLTVQVQNNGTIALPAGEQITLQVRAHNVITGKNYILNANATQKYSVSNLGIGATLNIAPNLQFTGNTLPAGSYALQALITPVQAITESNTANNLITANAAGQPTTLVSQTGAAPDLTGLFANSTVQSNPGGTTGTLAITLTNAGTATLVGPQPISFAITARNSLIDLPFSLTTLPQKFSVSNLKVGQSATFTVTLNAGQLATGTWMLTAAINAPGLTGPTAGNLIAVTKTGGALTVVSNNALSLFSGTALPGSVTALPTSVLVNDAGHVDLTDLAAILNNFGAVTLPPAATYSAIQATPATTTSNALIVTAAPAFSFSIMNSAPNLPGATVSGTSSSVGLTNFGTTTLSTTGSFDGAATIDLTDLSAVLNNFGASNTTTAGSANLTSTGPTGGVLTLNPGTLNNLSNITLSIIPTGTTPNPSDGTGLTLTTINPGDGTTTLNLPPNVTISK